MPAPVHARLRLGGSLYNDARWSIGVNVGTSVGTDPFSGGTTDVQGALQDWADNVRGLNGNNILNGAMLAMLSTQGTIDFVRTARVGLDGKESAVALITLTPVVRGQGDPKHPAQTALAVSLQSGLPGASNRGRLYLPAIGGAITAGRVPAATADELATACAQWIHDVGDAANNFSGAGVLDTEVVVASNVRSRLSVVQSVRVGNRFDSQRRRAEGEQEVYSVAPVPQ